MSIFDSAKDFALGPAQGLMGIAGEAFKAPDAPPTPDFLAAAQATAAGNKEMAEMAINANRPDQYTPWGSSTWNQDAGGNWTQNVNLSPEQQALFNKNQDTNMSMANLGLMGLDNTKDLFSSRFSTSGMPDVSYQQQGGVGGARQSVMDAMLSRVNTDISRDRDSRRSELIAQGIPVGSEAFKREMENIDRKQTDARQQAEISATDQTLRERGEERAGNLANYRTGVDQRNRGVRDALLERQTPLNELNAFRSGNQVSMPQFSPFAQQQAVPGADVMGATMAQGNWDMAGYNADVAHKNAIMGGLFSLGGAAIGAA